MKRKLVRMCKRFYCDARGDQFCCRDCPKWIRSACRNPCQNDPRHCKLEDVDRRGGPNKETKE